MSRRIELHPTEAQLRLVYNLIKGHVLATEDPDYWDLTAKQWAALERFANQCETAFGITSV